MVVVVVVVMVMVTVTMTMTTTMTMMMAMKMTMLRVVVVVVAMARVAARIYVLYIIITLPHHPMIRHKVMICNFSQGPWLHATYLRVAKWQSSGSGEQGFIFFPKCCYGTRFTLQE